MPKISAPKYKETGFAHIFVLIAVLVVGGLVISSNIKNSTSNVLGDDTTNVSEQTRKADQKNAEQAQEAQKQQAEQQKESLKNKAGVLLPAGPKMNSQSEGKKQETEVKTPDGQKIKTKVEDNGITKVEIEQGKLKVKYSIKNGKVKFEVENEASKEAKISEKEIKDAEDEIENELEKEGVKIATSGGQLAIAKNKFAATSNFPLSVDMNTKQLIVITPKGQKAVAVLPDQAIQNLLAAGVISQIESQSIDANLTKGLGDLNGVVNLEERGSEMVYRIKGIKNRKLLGIIPLSIKSIVYVSASSGSLIAEDQSAIVNLIKLLSF